MPHHDNEHDSLIYYPPPAKVIGFTASRIDPDEAASAVIARRLAGFRNPRGFVTGGCAGGDHRIAVFLAEVYPHVPQLVILPADRSRVHEWWQPYLDDPGHSGRIVVREMPPGSTYRDRNAAIVAISDVLLGFPAASETDPATARSGSWQTIRLARAKPIPTHVYALDVPVSDGYVDLGL